MPREDQLRQLHVVVGIIADDDNRILIQQRSDGPFAGLWEYPGGKVETGESVGDALARELKEELGLGVQRTTPLITITHRYPDRVITLDTHSIDAHDGQVSGAEGQPIRWVDRAQLFDEPLLPADQPLTMAINLPHTYWSLDTTGGVATSIRQLESVLSRARLKTPHQPMISLNMTSDADAGGVRSVAQWCASHQIRLLLAGGPQVATWVDDLNAAGVQCPISTLSGARERPVTKNMLLGVSVRNAAELAIFDDVGADFGVFDPGPLRQHDVDSWTEFADVARGASVPLYANIKHGDVGLARQAGGQGVMRRISPD
ncbi:MAG: NUDIX domain-containing protein [Gammaproteobacteria bacterium]